MNQGRRTLQSCDYCDPKVARQWRRWSRHILVGLAMSVSLLSLGCKVKVARQKPTTSLHPDNDISATPEQVRLRMRSLVEPMAGEIERAADQIGSSTSDVAVKRAAIRWKIEGVPAMRAALFQPDPFTALMDSWILTYQMADFFEKGPGREALGTSAPIAVETCRALEEDFEKVVATFTVSHDVSKVRAYARQWALDHPIRYAIQDRESALSRVFERDLGPELNLGETVAEITTTADDLHREIQIYSDHLFRQARWEAELLKLDFGGADVVPMAERAVKSSERAAATLDNLAPSIKSAANTAANIPEFVTSERKSAVDAVNDNVTKTLSFIHDERVGSMQDIGNDLQLVLQQVTHERIATMKEVSDERVSILAGIKDERVAALGEFRDIAETQRLALSRDIEQAGNKLVDRAAWRSLQVLAVIFVFLLVYALLVLLLIRKLFVPGQAHH